MDIILEKLNNIERYSLLAAKRVLTVDDVAILTGMSKSNIYKLTCNKQIPYYNPNGKCIFFDKAEIESWLLRNKQTPVL